jgi:branched-chain amino acid transport system permease protein
MSAFEQQVVNGLALGGLYALIAVGYTMVLGVLRVLNMAHGAFVMLGGVATVIATLFLARIGIASIVAIPIAIIAVGGVLAVVLYATTIAPVPKTNEWGPALATLGFTEIVTNLVVVWQGSLPIPFPISVPVQSINVFGLFVPTVSIAGFVLAAVATLGLMVVVRRTRIGLQIQAIADNLTAAEVVGLPYGRVVTIVVIMSSTCAAVAGIVIGLRFGVIDPFVALAVAIKGLAIMVIGGLGSIPGAFVAGVGVGVIELLSAAYLNTFWSDSAAWLLLLVILIVRPQGLFASRHIELR